MGQQPYLIKHCTATETPRRIPRDTTAWGVNGPLAQRPITPSRESQVHLEAARSTTIILPRTTTTSGTWNVRTIYDTGKTAQVAAEMRNYRLSILGISESRWNGSGQRRLITGELLLFSGHEQENAPHTQGVALMLSRTAQRAQIGWEGHRPRINTATIRTKERRINMDMMQYYAPRQGGVLQKIIIQDRPERNIIIAMGDFNARIGSDSRGYEEIMGQQSQGDE